MKYKNLDGSLPHALSSVFKWAVADRLSGKRSPSKKPFDVPRVANDGRALRENRTEPWLTWVGHATWIVQVAGKTLLIDPIWAKAISGVIPRKSEPGVAIADLPKIDAVLVSHNHRDHMDAPTLAHFKDAEAIVPSGVGEQMKKLGYQRVRELDWWQAHAVGDAFVHFVPSQHWSRRGVSDTNESLWGGFVIVGGGVRAYHSGDTAYFNGFKTIGERLGPIDAAMLPIGAYDPEWFMRKQHMNPEDAVNAFRDLRARRMLPMHWGTYQLTDEWIGEPPEKLRALAPEVALVSLGETVRFDAAASLLKFWFSFLSQKEWFAKSDALDNKLREQFASVHRDAMAGAHDAWLAEPHTRLAYIILLDQLSRNMFRGRPESFGSDALALKATLDGIEQGMDKTLSASEKQFFYMPMMHAEDLAIQEHAITLFDPLGVGDFARKHRDIIARFGRFPHRNEVLGRKSSPEELEFVRTTPGF